MVLSFKAASFLWPMPLFFYVNSRHTFFININAVQFFVTALIFHFKLCSASGNGNSSGIKRDLWAHFKPSGCLFGEKKFECFANFNKKKNRTACLLTSEMKGNFLSVWMFCFKSLIVLSENLCKNHCNLV